MMWEIENENIEKEIEKTGNEIKDDMNLAINKINGQNEKIKNINDNKFKKLDKEINEGKEYQNIIEHGVFSGIKNFFTDIFSKNKDKNKKKKAIKNLKNEEKEVKRYEKEKIKNIKNIEKEFNKNKDKKDNLYNYDDKNINNLQKQADELDEMANVLFKNIQQSNEEVDILDKKMELYNNKVKLATANNKYLVKKIN